MAPPLTSWTRTKAADEACRAYLAGEKWAAIAERHGVSTALLSRLFRRRGIKRSRSCPRWCPWCGDALPHGKNRRYCSDTCRIEDWTDRCEREGMARDCTDCGQRFYGWRTLKCTRCAACRASRREAKAEPRIVDLGVGG